MLTGGLVDWKYPSCFYLGPAHTFLHPITLRPVSKVATFSALFNSGQGDFLALINEYPVRWGALCQKLGKGTMWTSFRQQFSPSIPSFSSDFSSRLLFDMNDTMKENLCELFPPAISRDYPFCFDILLQLDCKFWGWC